MYIHIHKYNSEVLNGSFKELLEANVKDPTLITPLLHPYYYTYYTLITTLITPLLHPHHIPMILLLHPYSNYNSEVLNGSFKELLEANVKDPYYTLITPLLLHLLYPYHYCYYPLILTP
jgi:hypothetical protein